MSVLQLAFGFKGRMRRLHWWLARLIALALMIAVVGVIGLTSDVLYASALPANDLPSTIGGLVLIIGYLLWIWMDIATIVKRFHDRDKSGWWVLIGFVPLIGGIWILVECGFLDGTPGPNDHGPSPKGYGADEEMVRAFT